MPNVLTTDMFIYLIDSRRYDDAEALVTPDITYENSRGSVSGWPAIRRGMDALNCFSATQHLIGNHLGWWDGDHFAGKTYCIASHMYERDGESRRYEMGICYDEHIVRFDGALKMKHRRLTLLWQHDLPTVAMPPQIFLDAMARLMPATENG
ncbi:nuclear transport factor 2 family protein [Sphingomonas sp. TX0543]|uniref:nuclear transport factor 2 family protein n=1 Tax=Sphingomonas sp. TX0543 TaxID=3399682 RepID=UPI003AFB3ACF